MCVELGGAGLPTSAAWRQRWPLALGSALLFALALALALAWLSRIRIQANMANCSANIDYYDYKTSDIVLRWWWPPLELESTNGGGPLESPIGQRN